MSCKAVVMVLLLPVSCKAETGLSKFPKLASSVEPKPCKYNQLFSNREASSEAFGGWVVLCLW